jgi:hypothetical protein
MAPARRRTTDDDRADGIAHRAGRALAAAGVRTLRALPLCIIAAAVTAASLLAWREAMADPRFRVDASAQALGPAPAHCDAAMPELRRLALVAAGRSTLDPLLPGDVRRAYESSPWVRGVRSVRRVFPDALAVEFLLRTPVAQVKHRDYYWLVDEDFVLLPVPGSRHAREGLPEVTGEVGRPPREGETWGDDGLADAVGVLRALRSSALSDELTPVRLEVRRSSFLDRLQRKRHTRPRIDVVTAEGVTIRWGRYNRGDFPDEMRTAEKIAMLRNLLAQDAAAVRGIRLDVSTRTAAVSLPEYAPY